MWQYSSCKNGLWWGVLMGWSDSRAQSHERSPRRRMILPSNLLPGNKPGLQVPHKCGNWPISSNKSHQPHCPWGYLGVRLVQKAETMDMTASISKTRWFWKTEWWEFSYLPRDCQKEVKMIFLAGESDLTWGHESGQQPYLDLLQWLRMIWLLLLATVLQVCL